LSLGRERQANKQRGNDLPQISFSHDNRNKQLPRHSDKPEEFVHSFCGILLVALARA
jgi:hypothetical protein